MKEKILHDELLEILNYNPITGVLTWKKTSKRTTRYLGMPIGSLSPDGFLGCNIKGIHYKVHQLAWFYYHGEWASKVFHINNNNCNNSIKNLTKDRSLKHIKRIKKRLTQERLKTLVHYNSLTGAFTLKIDTLFNKAGMIFNNRNAKGYIRFILDGYVYVAHRAAFLYMTGAWPKDQVDHINCITDDNRWCNLREATRHENRRNIRVQKNNKLGVKGVRLVKSGRYLARIRVLGVLENLGYYNTAKEASEAYRKRAEECFTNFARAV